MLSTKNSTEILPESSNTKTDKNIDRDTLIVPDGINEDEIPEKLTATQENNLVKRIESTKIVEEDKNDTKMEENEEEVEEIIEMDHSAESDPELMTFEGEEMYLVEEILEHKPKTASNHSKTKKYKILWEGYNDPSEHTWEPANSINETAPTVVDVYWEKVAKQKEIAKANNKKKKEAMKLAGAQKRRRFPDEIPEESIEKLNDSLENYQKITEASVKFQKINQFKFQKCTFLS